MTTDSNVLARLWRWVLLDGNRNLLAGLFSAGVFVGCLGTVMSGLLTIEKAGPIRTFLSAEIGGMVSFITIVVAINQLILTQEFGTMGAFNHRLSEMRDFRSKVERDADLTVSSADPSAFLNELLDAVLDCTKRLGRVDHTNDSLTDFTEEVIHTSQQARNRLDRRTDRTFDLVSVILDYDADFMLHRLRELQATGDIPDESTKALMDLNSLFNDIHVTGLYFKTVYVQQELADLSKLLLSVGMVSLLYGGFIVVSYENILAATPGRPLLTLVVCVALTVAFAPFAVLLAHILRIATVARRTTADFGPFLLQRQIPDEEE